MFITRCVDCNHEELTVNPGCLCKCHTPAPQPPPDWLEKWKWAYDRIAGLEAQLAEAQERLAMAAEALKPFAQAERAWMSGGPPQQIRMDWLTAAREAEGATAEAVAQHTASVERRGAKAALEAFAERDDWTLDVPRILVDRIRRLLTEAARAAELEGA